MRPFFTTFESVCFYIISFCCLLIISEDESIMDLTDLNLFHVFALSVSVVCIWFDNINKSVFGQYVDTDRQVFSYAGFYFNIMFWYFWFIWLMFYTHTVTPLFAENVDVSTLFVFYTSILSSLILRPILCLCFFLIIFTAYSRFGDSKASLFFIDLSTVFSVIMVWVSTWDLILKPVSSLNKKINSFCEYSGDCLPNSASSYTSIPVGGFDWFDGSSRPESLFLFDSAALFSAFFCWFFVAVGATFLVFCRLCDRGLFSTLDHSWFKPLDAKTVVVFSIMLSKHLIILFLSFSFVFIASFLRVLLSSTGWSLL